MCYNIGVRMKKPDYSFQVPMIQKSKENMLKHKISLLAASCGAGKTHMAILIVEWYLKNYKDDVLILAEGQTNLRSQFASEIGNRFRFSEVTALNSEFGEERVHVCIPHTFRSKDYKYVKGRKIGLLIVDEAHHFYLIENGMVQKIIANNKPKFQLLLTGTHFDFTYQNNITNAFPVTSISILELIEHGVVQEVVTILAQTTNFNYDMGDYTGELILKKEIEIGKSSEVLNELLTKIHARLISNYKTDPKYKDWLKDLLPNWDSLLQTLDKTMISCHGQKQAMDVHKYFQKLKINSVISTSDFGDSDLIKKFEEDKDCQVLIVVRRAIIGFNYPELVNHVDMSGTLNPIIIFQKIGRLVRVHPEGRPKLYVKVCPTSLAWVNYAIMSLTLSLIHPELYNKFDGNISKFSFPMKKKILDEVKREKIKRKKEKGSSHNIDVDKLPDFITFRDIEHIDNGAYEEYAYTTFSDVKELLGEQLTAADSIKILEDYMEDEFKVFETKK